METLETEAATLDSAPETNPVTDIEIDIGQTGESDEEKNASPDEGDASPFAIDPRKMPVRMLPISSEDLEHVDDKKLDAEYDSRLLKSGDDLLPIMGGAEILKDFVDVDPKTEAAKDQDNGNVNKPSSNRAVEIAIDLGSEEESESVEIPVMPDDPSQKELIEYAEKHPTVRHVLKLFRGKVVSVRKK